MEKHDRKESLKSANKCFFCLQPGHSVKSCPKKDAWKPCKKDGCGQLHHWSLHEDVATPSVSAVYSTGLMPPSDASFWVQVVDAVSAKGDVMACTVMYDSGANMSMVTESFADKLKLKIMDSNITVSLAAAQKHELNRAVQLPIP